MISMMFITEAMWSSNEIFVEREYPRKNLGPAGNRTHDLPFSRRMLLPLSYWNPDDRGAEIGQIFHFLNFWFCLSHDEEVRLVRTKQTFFKSLLYIIRASLSEPHIDHDNGPRVGNNGIYVSVYHLPCVCCTLVPDIHVCPEMLHVFRYIDVVHDCQDTGARLTCCLLWRLSMKTGR